MYYVRRAGTIKGPLTREKLSSLRQEKRLRMRDEVSESPDGPWRMFRDAHDLVLTADDSTRDDSVSVTEEPLSPPSGVAKPEKFGESDREWHASLQTWIEGDHLFRKPFRPWKYLLGGVFLVALAIYAMSIVLRPH
jgi:hypothetical protein